MSFWRYFKEKLGGIGYIVLGFAVIAAGALVVVYFHPASTISLNLETFCCAGGALIVIVGIIAIAYGQKKLAKLDE